MKLKIMALRRRELADIARSGWVEAHADERLYMRHGRDQNVAIVFEANKSAVK